VDAREDRATARSIGNFPFKLLLPARLDPANLPVNHDRVTPAAAPAARAAERRGPAAAGHGLTVTRTRVVPLVHHDGQPASLLRVGAVRCFPALQSWLPQVTAGPGPAGWAPGTNRFMSVYIGTILKHGTYRYIPVYTRYILVVGISDAAQPGPGPGRRGRHCSAWL
jgi:hypothetical protein